MKIYVTSDTHFNHANIIKYCNRPFKNIDEMNEMIIEKWNKIVDKDDIVYHLGDFGFGSKESLQEIFNRLNEKKYLIMGNHDYRVGRQYYLELGFEEVYKKEFILNNYIMTHKPKEINSSFINLYGHIHDKPVDTKYDDDNHICVCLDKTNFEPLLLIKIDGDLK